MQVRGGDVGGSGRNTWVGHLRSFVEFLGETETARVRCEGKLGWLGAPGMRSLEPRREP